MNEALKGTGIEYHECPDCGAALERNVELEWNSAPVRSPETYTPAVKCVLCGCDAGAAYGLDTALNLLEDAGIDIDETTPGEPVKAR